MSIDQALREVLTLQGYYRELGAQALALCERQRAIERELDQLRRTSERIAGKCDQLLAELERTQQLQRTDPADWWKDAPPHGHRA
jgi:hypothetical protein